MARRIVDEELKYTVIVNGDSAQKELFDLERQQRKQVALQKEQRAQKKKLQAENKQGTAEWKKLTAEMRTNNQAIKANDARQAELRSQIGITSLSMAQLGKEAKRLRLALLHMTPGSAEFKRTQNDLQKINAQLRKVRSGAAATQFSIGKVADKMNRFAAMGATVIATVGGMVLSFQKLIDYSGKLADAQADVAKTTGLTDEAIDEITRKLGVFKTRTARIELLALAEEAGRLGKKSVDDILDFVGTADQIRVALGDDLQGDVNENVRLIGKLADQYRVGAEFGATMGESMTMVGSAINEVSASGAANAGFMVDYMKRMVGVARVSNMTADQQIGFAAVLDEAGQSVEVSGTAMSKLVVDMAGNLKDYAKIAGESEDDFRRLFNEDANEALLRFLQGLNGNTSGLEAMAAKMEGLGVDGARATAVLAALSTQTDKVREKQDLANKSMNEATSLTDEFNRKNTNFAATLDQIRKKMTAFFAEGGFAKMIENAVTWFAKLIGAIEDTDGSVTRFRQGLVAFIQIVAVAAAGLLGYKASLVLVNLWSGRAATAEALRAMQTKITVFWTGLARSATLLYTAATARMTGNVIRANEAMKLFNATSRANPLGIILTVVTAAYAAWKIYGDNVDAAAKAQQNITDVNNTASRNIAEEVAKVTSLVRIAKDETIAREKRLEAIKELNKISPEYLGNLDLDKINHIESKKAIDDYIESLKKKALAMAVQEKQVELFKKMVDVEQSSLEDNVNIWEKGLNFMKAGGIATAAYARDIKTGVRNREESIAAIKAEQEALAAWQVEMIKAGKLDTPVVTAGNDGNDGDGGGSANDTTKKSSSNEKTIIEFENLRMRIKEIRREMEQELLSANEREIQAIEDKYAALILQAGINEDQMAELRELRQAELDATLLRQTEAFEKAKLDVRKRHNLLSHEELLAQEVELLRAELEAKIITEEEFMLLKAEKEKQLELEKEQREQEAFERKLQRYRDEIAIYGDMINQMGGLVSGFKDAELAGIEEVSQREGESEEDFTRRKEAEEKKRKEIVKKYAGTELLIQAAQIIANTAAGIMKAYASLDPITASVYAAIIAGTGYTQYKKAKAEYNKIQGYEDGFYPVQDQLGRRFNARPVANARTGMINDPSILVGEKPELIIDPKTTRHLRINAPEIIDSIYAAAARVRGFEGGHYPRRTASDGASSGIDLSELVTESRQNRKALKQLIQVLNKPFVAVVGESQLPNLSELLEDNEDLELNSRIKQL